jgi:hypothetical protein
MIHVIIILLTDIMIHIILHIAIVIIIILTVHIILHTGNRVARNELKQY